MNPSLSQKLKSSRLTGLLVVAILLLNIASSIVMANTQNAQQYAWLCTSQGLVKVILGSESIGEQKDQQKGQLSSQQRDHCPYCQLFDSSLDFTNTELGYAHPELPLDYLYQAPQTEISLRSIFNTLRSRAPPSYFLV